MQVLIVFNGSLDKVQYVFDKFTEIIDRSENKFSQILNVMWTDYFKSVTKKELY